jgi:Ser/Thr protein kinase RdoA (MazF antagonist)
MSRADFCRQAPSELDDIARQVLARFDWVQPALGLVSCGNAGGFSGARLWRAKSLTGDVCLRAWPSEAISPSRLQAVHGLMRAASGGGLNFVPRLLETCTGSTWVSEAGRVWDATSWMPGRADYHGHPSRVRLEAACNALARLHETWTGAGCSEGPCPAVGRRLARFREWKHLVASGWRPDFSDPHDPVSSPADLAWELLKRHIDAVPDILSGWASRRVRLQPCLCDVWHDHVLFDGDAVSGVVDYGGAKIDHVAIDLARLLGSMVEDDVEARSIGLSAYSLVRPLDGQEIHLVDVLDRIGTLLGLANWLVWIYGERRQFEDRRAVAARIGQLVRRVGRW